MINVSRILIVDDCEPDQFLCSCLIDDYDSNIEVLQAYDGQEALELLNSMDGVPDIIFLDINMPRMNGHEFLEAYSKNTEQEKGAVVVMLTSSSIDKDKDKAMAYDFVKLYLSKPLSKTTIEEVVEKL